MAKIYLGFAFFCMFNLGCVNRDGRTQEPKNDSAGVPSTLQSKDDLPPEISDGQIYFVKEVNLEELVYLTDAPTALGFYVKSRSNSVHNRNRSKQNNNQNSNNGNNNNIEISVPPDFDRSAKEHQPVNTNTVLGVNVNDQAIADNVGESIEIAPNFGDFIGLTQEGYILKFTQNDDKKTHTVQDVSRSDVETRILANIDGPVFVMRTKPEGGLVVSYKNPEGRISHAEVTRDSAQNYVIESSIGQKADQSIEDLQSELIFNFKKTVTSQKQILPRPNANANDNQVSSVTTSQFAVVSRVGDFLASGDPKLKQAMSQGSILSQSNNGVMYDFVPPEPAKQKIIYGQLAAVNPTIAEIEASILQRAHVNRPLAESILNRSFARDQQAAFLIREASTGFAVSLITKTGQVQHLAIEDKVVNGQGGLYVFVMDPNGAFLGSIQKGPFPDLLSLAGVFGALKFKLIDPKSIP